MDFQSRTVRPGISVHGKPVGVGSGAGQVVPNRPADCGNAVALGRIGLNFRKAASSAPTAAKETMRKPLVILTIALLLPLCSNKPSEPASLVNCRVASVTLFSPDGEMGYTQLSKLPFAKRNRSKPFSMINQFTEDMIRSPLCRSCQILHN